MLYNRAYVYPCSKDARALKTERKAFEPRPRDPVDADTYGWALTEAGMAAEGLKLLAQATRAAPNTSEIRYHCAVALAKSGTNEKARAVVRQMLADAELLPVGPNLAKRLH